MRRKSIYRLIFTICLLVSTWNPASALDLRKNAESKREKLGNFINQDQQQINRQATSPIASPSSQTSELAPQNSDEPTVLEITPKKNHEYAVICKMPNGTKSEKCIFQQGNGEWTPSCGATFWDYPTMKKAAEVACGIK